MKTTTLATLALATTTFAGPATAPAPAPAPDNPLSFADGRVVLDVQNRARWEIRENNFDFNDATRGLLDDNWFLNRFRIGLTLKPADWLTIYGQAQDAREWLSDRADIPGVLGADGDDSFDLRQAWFEISAYDTCPWGLRIGRQVLAYGDQRLIGPLDWTNLARSFDAVRLTYKQKDWSVDAFASTVVTADRGSFNQSDLFNGTETDREQVFSGIYYSTEQVPWQVTDAYTLHLHEDLAGGDTNFMTLGLRMKSKPGYFAPHYTAALSKDNCEIHRDGNGEFDFDFEAAFQTGEVGGRDLTAWAVHTGVGYTFDTPWMPRVGLEYNYGSGDGDPTDGDVETFQNLFPTNHIYYGFMDAFSWQNVHDLALTLKATPVKGVTVRTDFHAFWLATTNDSWYRANGTTTVRPLNAAARSASNYAGSELDVVVTWAVNKHLTLEAGYSHFWAGDYLADTGASDDADFGYVQATVTF